MNDLDLDALLASIDAATETPTDAEDRVWQRLRADLFADADGTSSKLGDEDDVIVELGVAPIVSTEPVATRDHRRRLLVLAAAAAAIVIAGIAAAFLVARDNEVQVIDDPTVVDPIVLDRPDACLRFRTDSPLFVDIEAMIASDPSAGAGLIEDMRDGLTQLRGDLEASESVTLLTLTQTFPSIEGALNQARLFLLADDVDGARQALDFAEDAYRESQLFADRCLG